MRQIEALVEHFDGVGRPEATDGLIEAVGAARRRIGSSPNAGLVAPRPYPALAREGERWVKAGRYWFAYRLSTPPIVIAVFYDQADIPARFR